MPTTISTNVVFTKQAGGNEAVSLINSVVGNVAGIFVTPALLQGYLGSSGQVGEGGREGGSRARAAQRCKLVLGWRGDAAGFWLY